MDSALRELGVGDTSVPKRKKKMIRTFYALVEELSAVLDADDQDALTGIIDARFDGTARQTPFESARLATYVRTCASRLDQVTTESIFKNDLVWTDPAMVH